MTNMNWADFGQLAAFLVVVWYFLQHIDKKDKSMTELHIRCEESIAAIAKENNELSERCLAAFKENTIGFSRIQQVLEKIELMKL